MSAPDDLRAVIPVVEALEAAGVEYYIGGSVASSHHGVMRSTIDIDLVADLREEHVERFIAVVGGGYYADAAMIRDAIRQRSSFNLIHLDTMYKIDVFVMKDTPFDRVARQRVIEEDLLQAPGRLFRIAAAEDVLLHKLTWYRDGDELSERQWNDVLGIMRVGQEQLDREYLQRWGTDLGVADLVQRGWEEIEGDDRE